ncbi:MBL fold metallo-hydrolase [Sporomusa aerivorans]|uniref:MBL fold metallo-hydrolase n=1 Tax=Sporomusa aerivorans TaxID=204936 RepID=UPI00352B39AD
MGLEVDLLTAGYCVHPEKMTARDRAFHKKKFPAMAAVIKHPAKGYILFDTGHTMRFFSETLTWPLAVYRYITPVYLQKGESIVEQLHSQGIQAHQVRYAILSHFHADHIGGCRDFSQATFIVHEDAYNAVQNLEGIKALRAGFIKNLLPEDFTDRLRLLSDGDAVHLPLEHRPFEYGFDIFEDGSLFLVVLAGHAKGQLGIMIPNSTTGGYFLIADACWQKCSYTQLMLPHWLTKLIMANWTEYIGTLKKIHEYAKSHPNIAVIPSHCTETLEGMASVSK